MREIKMISPEMFRLKAIVAMQRIVNADYRATELESVMKMLYDIDQCNETEFTTTCRENIYTKLNANKLLNDYDNLYDVQEHCQKTLTAINLY